MLEVKVTRRASAQIERDADWWAESRPAAPDAIRIDFQEAKALLARQPGVDARSRTARYPNLLRLYLARVRYHLYYEVREGTVVILAFWHASRGTGPGL